MQQNGEIYKSRYRNFILISIIPAMILYIIFMIYPIAETLYYSLFHWAGFSPDMDYVGVSNYLELTGDSLFITTVITSLKYVFLGGFIILGITLLFTYAIINFKSERLKSAVQMILFVPNTISPVALALLWGFILNTRWGLLNTTLSTIGLETLTRGWMGDDYIFAAALSLLVWIHVGFFIVIFVAATDRIPNSLYESAELDGASSLDKFTKITFPLVKDIIEVCMVLWTIFSFKIFGYIHVFGAGTAASQAHVGIRNISVQLYLTAFGRRTAINRVGYASAMAIVLLILLAILVYAIKKIMAVEPVEY